MADFGKELAPIRGQNLSCSPANGTLTTGPVRADRLLDRRNRLEFVLGILEVSRRRLAVFRFDSRQSLVHCGRFGALSAVA